VTSTRRLASVAALLLAVTSTADDLDQAIRQEVERLGPGLIEARRWFHQHPELSNREVETAREIARRLTALGLEVRTGVARTGVVAVLRGGKPGGVAAWRADIDALPIGEQVDVPWTSTNPGVMHACGHDVHITVGLGAAEVLSRLRERVPGTVVFFFQPAEEGAPAGEEGGAALMIAEGVLNDPRPQAIFGLHVMPTLSTGQVGSRAGGIMAASDALRITVAGKTTHGSAPHEGVDAVYVAAQVVTALQSVVSREVDSRRPAVVSIGSLHAGNRNNIIAGEAVMEGTVRTLDEATRAQVRSAVERVVAGVCQAHRATCRLEFEPGNPPTVNDPALALSSAAALRSALDPEAVIEIEPIMAAEDFALFAERVPGFYFHLGVGNPEQGWTSYVHTPTFRPDEASLAVGVRAAAALLVAANASNR
jgi:amidohydrolase